MLALLARFALLANGALLALFALATAIVLYLRVAGLGRGEWPAEKAAAGRAVMLFAAAAGLWMTPAAIANPTLERLGRIAAVSIPFHLLWASIKLNRPPSSGRRSR